MKLGMSNSDAYDPSTECRVCSVIDTRRAAKHLLSSSEWDYYYCRNCGNWFQVADGSRNSPALIHDKKLIVALNAYYANSVEEFEGVKEGLDVLHKILEKIGSVFGYFVPRYSV